MKDLLQFYKNFVKSLRASLLLRSFVDFYSHNVGFTLIEILVTVTILSLFAAGMMLAIDPREQINKAKNASSINNLKELKNALQLYYEDHKCYPEQDSVFTQTLYNGGAWTENGIIYMQDVPRDGEESYIYVTDSGGSCPQWNVVFSKLAKEPTDIACPLEKFPGEGCTPPDYEDYPYACTMSGSVNCSFIREESSIQTAYMAGAPVPPTPTVGPTAQPIATPTTPPGGSNPSSGPSDRVPGGVTISDTTAEIPNLTEYYYAPYAWVGDVYNPPQIGDLQYFDATFSSPASPITSVEVLIVNDSTDMTSLETMKSTAIRKQLSLLSGTETEGIWGGVWEVDYGLYDRYKIIIVATDEANNVSERGHGIYGNYDPPVN